MPSSSGVLHRLRRHPPRQHILCTRHGHQGAGPAHPSRDRFRPDVGGINLQDLDLAHAAVLQHPLLLQRASPSWPTTGRSGRPRHLQLPQIYITYTISP